MADEMAFKVGDHHTKHANSSLVFGRFCYLILLAPTTASEVWLHRSTGRYIYDAVFLRATSLITQYSS